MAYEPAQGTAPRPIETASATTSPDNANSGPHAYYIALGALIALILFSSMMGGCVAATFKSVYYLVEDDILATNWDEVLFDENGEEYNIYDYEDIDYMYNELFDVGNHA